MLDELVDWTIPAVVRALAISRRHALRLMRRHAEQFDPPRYRKFNHRWLRVLTPREARTLKRLLAIRTAPRG